MTNKNKRDTSYNQGGYRVAEYRGKDKISRVRFWETRKSPSENNKRSRGFWQQNS
jgi:hypothetical protein